MEAMLLAVEHDFNPRSPHGERPIKELDGRVDTLISIHAPRTGSDGISPHCISSESIFQSTLPARGATSDEQYATTSYVISIHAPRTGSD